MKSPVGHQCEYCVVAHIVVNVNTLYVLVGTQTAVTRRTIKRVWLFGTSWDQKHDIKACLSLWVTNKVVTGVYHIEVTERSLLN